MPGAPRRPRSTNTNPGNSHLARPSNNRANRGLRHLPKIPSANMLVSGVPSMAGSRPMAGIVKTLLGMLLASLKPRASLCLENLALRHQLAVLRRTAPRRVRLRIADRLLFVWLYRLWPGVLEAMAIVRPAVGPGDRRLRKGRREEVEGCADPFPADFKPQQSGWIGPCYRRATHWRDGPLRGAYHSRPNSHIPQRTVLGQQTNLCRGAPKHRARGSP
jgi:hypothetical protein